jgi:hypothetical protein
VKRDVYFQLANTRIYNGFLKCPGHYSGSIPIMPYYSARERKRERERERVKEREREREREREISFLYNIHVHTNIPLEKQICICDNDFLYVPHVDGIKWNWDECKSLRSCLSSNYALVNASHTQCTSNGIRGISIV